MVFIGTNACTEAWAGGFADVADCANMNSLFEVEGGKKRRRTARVLWPEGRTPVCLPLARFLPWCPSAVTCRTGRQLGKMVSTDPPTACGWLAERRTSMSFTPQHIKGWVLWVPLWQERLFRANAGKGNCVAGLGWPWGEDEVEKLRKTQVMGELYWVSEMEDLMGFGRSNGDVFGCDRVVRMGWRNVVLSILSCVNKWNIK